jgi:hypothetical protein
VVSSRQSKMAETTPLLAKSLREQPGFLSTADYVLILPGTSRRRLPSQVDGTQL